NGNVSSAIPNVVPPSPNKIIDIGIIRSSFPLNLEITEAIPASIAPVLFTIPKALQLLKQNLQLQLNR
ncbi:hypothetical protein BM531_23820, partial [Clostridioides difficile]